jgi:hypothetical protein
MVVEPIGTVRAARSLPEDSFWGGIETAMGSSALDGTPVIDIKPVRREFLPRSALVQPPSSIELMARYWNPS